MLVSRIPCFRDPCYRLCVVDQPEQDTSMPVGQHPRKGLEEVVSFAGEPAEL